jgi:hypothetical protein
MDCCPRYLVAAQEDSRNHEVLDGDGVGVLCLQTDEDSTRLGASVDEIRLESHDLAAENKVVAGWDFHNFLRAEGPE